MLYTLCRAQNHADSCRVVFGAYTNHTDSNYKVLIDARHNLHMRLTHTTIKTEISTESDQLIF